MLDHHMGLIINDERLDDFKASTQKTVIVSGASRGGTSLVAYALRRCGVDFGDVSPRNHEPLALLHGDRTEAGIRTYLRGLQMPGATVGAKFPAFTFHLSWMDQTLTNVVFVHVIRSPLDTAKTVMKRDPNHEFCREHFAFGLKHSATYHDAFTAAVATMKNPIVALSYERAKAKPAALLKLFDQIGICSEPEDADDIIQSIRTPGYKEV